MEVKALLYFGGKRSGLSLKHPGFQALSYNYLSAQVQVSDFVLPALILLTGKAVWYDKKTNEF